MVAYSFNPRFIEPIRQGLKTQTIRSHSEARQPRPGQLLQLYTGMRTKNCRRILPDVPCLTVMKVRITFDLGQRPVIGRITTDGVPVRDLDAFAIRDGFTDIEDMSAFWRDHHPQATAAGFEGVLIEWARPAETMLGVAA
jgi:hypothetical protein